MPNDTAEAMDHLRESCAIATGKAPPPPPPYRPEVDPFGRQSIPNRPRPRLEDEYTGEAIQVTCWEAGGMAKCRNCTNWCGVITDGSKEWIACQACETVRVLT